MTIQRILVPTDFSETSLRALEAAIGMAKAFGATIELLHVTGMVAVLPPPIDIVAFSAVTPELLRKGQERLDQAAQRVLEAGIPCETRSLEGTPHSEIVQRALDMPADLIVMGTHGHGGLAHAVLGSVAERVLHRSRCPVLVVPVARS